jgi:hypothetical protein
MMKKVIYILGILLPIIVNAQSTTMTRLTKEQAQAMIRQKGGRADSSTYRPYNITAYLLSDGSVVINDHDRYVHYDSVRSLDAVLKGHKSIEEILYGRNPFGKDFPRQVPVLISALLEEFRLDRRTVVDEALLLRLDSLLQEREDAAQLKEKYLLHFLALVGQVLVDEKGAAWMMELSTDGETWNSHLEYQGRQIVLITDLQENLQGREDHTPLHLTYMMIGDIIRLKL